MCGLDPEQGIEIGSYKDSLGQNCTVVRLFKANTYLSIRGKNKSDLKFTLKLTRYINTFRHIYI